MTFDTLIALVDTLKQHADVTILTKQPSVVEKFCEENGITAKIYEWKLGGPSFKIQKAKSKKQKEGMIGSENS